MPKLDFEKISFLFQPAIFSQIAGSRLKQGQRRNHVCCLYDDIFSLPPIPSFEHIGYFTFNHSSIHHSLSKKKLTMSTDMAPTPPSSLIENVITAYINDGNLSSTLNAEGCSCFPIVKFVSFRNGVVRILVAGDCPGCDSPWLRDICNKKFCLAATMVTSRAIPQVTKLQPVFTFDHDFSSIVASFGYRIRYPIHSTDEKRMTEVLKMMMDFHPLVQSYTKILSRRGENMREISRTAITTWDEMTSTYNGVWMVDSAASCLSIEGDIADENEILGEDFNLPPFLVDMTQSGVPHPMLMSFNPAFFDPHHYVVIETVNN